MWSPPHKTRPINDIRIASQYRLKQERIFAGMVFKIGVLDDGEVAGRICSSSFYRGAFTLVVGMLNIFQIGIWVCIIVTFYKAICIVFGAVIYDDHFLFNDALQFDFKYSIQQDRNGIPFIITRNDD